ncbi:MAG: hypothetical protein ACXVDZ_09825 [Bacteroidia bacterium]
MMKRGIKKKESKYKVHEKHRNYLLEIISGKSLDYVFGIYSLPDLIKLMSGVDFIASL